MSNATTHRYLMYLQYKLYRLRVNEADRRDGVPEWIIQEEEPLLPFTEWLQGHEQWIHKNYGFNWRIGELPAGWSTRDVIKFTNQDYSSGPTAAMYIDFTQRPTRFDDPDPGSWIEFPRWTCDEAHNTPRHVIIWLRWFSALGKWNDE